MDNSHRLVVLDCVGNSSVYNLRLLHHLDRLRVVSFSGWSENLCLLRNGLLLLYRCLSVWRVRDYFRSYWIAWIGVWLLSSTWRWKSCYFKHFLIPGRLWIGVHLLHVSRWRSDSYSLRLSHRLHNLSLWMGRIVLYRLWLVVNWSSMDHFTPLNMPYSIFISHFREQLVEFFSINPVVSAEVLRSTHSIDQLLNLRIRMLVEQGLLVLSQHFIEWFLVRVLAIWDRLVRTLRVLNHVEDHSLVFGGVRRVLWLAIWEVFVRLVIYRIGWCGISLDTCITSVLWWVRIRHFLNFKFLTPSKVKFFKIMDRREI